MKRLLLFGGLALVMLGSITPPAGGSEGVCASSTGCGPDADIAGAAQPRLPFIPPEPLPVLAGYLATEPVVPAAPAGPLPPATAAAPASPPALRILVSLPQQKAYVFRHGDLVATSPVSTGKKGFETPAGTFRILQKKVHHRSTTYDNAPMPYMQRLTWSGVALHAGHVPGRPASHGCIRLPRSFAKKLYRMTNFRTTVTITRARPSSAGEALKLI